MTKETAIDAIGEFGLLLPARVKAALTANDRVKLWLSAVQAAMHHADRPKSGAIDLSKEQAMAGLKQPWIDEMVASASRSGDVYFLPGLQTLLKAMGTDLAALALPVLKAGATPALQNRCAEWNNWLLSFKDETISTDQFDRLAHGNREHGDSLHILVMDLHKQLNQIASKLATDDIDGAHTWNLETPDCDRVRAFMRGLNRTARLKFDHPGLETAATRDGNRLVLQNDIGTNDAHVLVIHIEDLRIVLTYSDLHRGRFEFFRAQLSEVGATWSIVEPHVTPGLNAGEAYFVGHATFTCGDLGRVDRTLEQVGALIVFLIDWNRARKRLQKFVSKRIALEILTEVAHAGVGHMGWLKAGSARMLFSAMQAAGDGVFRLGDRLDSVLGEADAKLFLVEAMSLACRALLDGRPTALVEDETRVLLTRHLQSSASEFDLAAEHAAYCHELAQNVRDALTHRHGGKQIATLGVRAKGWERRADELLNQAREAAQRHPRWQRFARLMAQADDIADCLEESAFLLSVIAEEHDQTLQNGIQQAMLELATSVLGATQEYVKALAIARTLAHAPELEASNAFLDATWRVVLAEISCDEQLRATRRTILRELSAPAEVMLASDLANSLEQAADALMASSYALREIVLDRAGVR